QRQVNVARDHNAVEALGKFPDFEDAAHGAAFSTRAGALARRGDLQMSRAGTSPCGRKNMKTSTRPVKSKPWIGPSTLGGICRKLIACGSASSSNAPTTGPQVVRMPPTTTMVRIADDCRISNCSGVMKRK